MNKKRTKKIIAFLLVVAFVLGNSPASAIYIYSAKSRSMLFQESLQSTLPGFRHDVNLVELNRKTPIQLILSPEAQTVEVEVIEAEGFGLGIDNTTLLNEGLKVLKPNRLRNRLTTTAILKERKSNPNNKAKFNLKKQKNQQQIIEAVDFKIFNVQLKAALPANYIVRAIVDGKEEVFTRIVTKPPFRLDAITPSVLDLGAKTIISLIGKGLDAFTEVFITGGDVDILSLESLDDSTLKIITVADEDANPGFRDVTITNPLIGETVTLVNGLYVGPKLGIDGMDGLPGIVGPQGPQGQAGSDGMSICDDPLATLTIISTSLLPGLQPFSNFDSTQCILTLGIPAGIPGTIGMSGGSGETGATGATGAAGTNGTNGSNGLVKVSTESAGANCANGGKKVESGIDDNNDGTLAAGEVDAVNYVCNGATGATGAAGAAGTNGTNGSNSLVKVSTESAGANCANGGKKVESGIDDNNDGTLAAGEVDATNYVCNGVDGDAIPTVEEVIASWSTYSNESNLTTASSDTTRMVKIPYFIHDGIIYGGFWIDKYEAARADATATSAGTSSVPISKRNVVPWGSINYATAKANAESANRQISSLGSCKLIKMKEWYALYLLGRFAKQNNQFGATSVSGWNERGNTRSGKDGRDDGSKICSDDPTESGGTVGRCLTGTGFKSWGHLLGATATKDPDNSTLSGAGTADATVNGTDAFDGDLQVYDLVGNVVEWNDYTITKSGSGYIVDPGFQGSNVEIPYTSNNKYFDFDDVAGNTNTSNNSDEIEFRGLGLPYTGAMSNVTDLNGGLNDGLFSTDSTNQQYGTVRGGHWASSSDARSPIYLDFSTVPTTTEDKRGFRVTCDLP